MANRLLRLCLVLVLFAACQNAAPVERQLPPDAFTLLRKAELPNEQIKDWILTALASPGLAPGAAPAGEQSIRIDVQKRAENIHSADKENPAPGDQASIVYVFTYQKENGTELTSANGTLSAQFEFQGNAYEFVSMNVDAPAYGITDLVKGTVTDCDGAPLYKAEVAVHTDDGQLKRTYTDAAGAYIIRAVKDAQVTVTFTAAGLVTETQTGTVPMRADAQLCAPEARMVTGFVVDADGLPLAGALVQAELAGGIPAGATMTTLAGGAFTLPDLTGAETAVAARIGGKEGVAEIDWASHIPSVTVVVPNHSPTCSLSVGGAPEVGQPFQIQLTAIDSDADTLHSTIRLNGDIVGTGVTAAWSVVYQAGDATATASVSDGISAAACTHTFAVVSAEPPFTLQGRTQLIAVSTGTEMIVWGGHGMGISADSLPGDGGRYNPATDTWLPLPKAGAPAPRWYPAGVWTGAEFVVVAGVHGGQTGGRYSPATNQWHPTATQGAPSPRTYLEAVWSGTELLLWGGANTTFTQVLADGARYNPVSDTWTAMSNTGVPAARQAHSSVWTGTHLIVWGGENGTVEFNTGGRYSPAGDSWLPVTIDTYTPIGRECHTAVWDGTRMIVWGGRYRGTNTPIRSGGRYDPASNQWLPVNVDANAAPATFSHTAVWTGSRMVVWGGATGPGIYTALGGVYDPALNRWTAMTTSGAPASRAHHAAAWVAGRVLVWGGYHGNESFPSVGGEYDPAANTWQLMTDPAVAQ